jgi:NAD(P)-dependent dehydrogenase (short-subunit alcohol dehydrogenase family)
VTDAAQVEIAAAAVEDRFGPVDIWINNAMVAVFSPVAEMTADEFRREWTAYERQHDPFRQRRGAFRSQFTLAPM